MRAHIYIFMQEFVEQEILAHFDIIHPVQVAAGPSMSSLQLVPLSSWEALKVVLKKLAYDTESKCPWSRLGFGTLDGPDPSEVAIQARTDSARLLCEHALGLAWSAEDLDRATKAGISFTDARDACCAQLPDVLRERRRLKVGKLPQWKEVGRKALRLLHDTRPDAEEIGFTQWSDLLNATPEETKIPTVRTAASLLEKGDGKLWEDIGVTPFTAWVPSDINSLSRVLATYVRGIHSQDRPIYFRLVAPLSLLPGMSNVSRILDFWQHPLLGDKWASLVKDVSIHNLPLEMVLPGAHGPKHVSQGMVVFTISAQGARGLPAIMEIEAPLMQLPEVPSIFVDTPPEHLCRLMQALATPEFSTIIYRAPSRGLGNLPSFPLLCLRAADATTYLPNLSRPFCWVV